MRIEDFRSSTGDGITRVSATVTWEDCERPRRELYMAAPDRFAGDLSLTPDAFLLAAILPASHHGERRVRVDGPVCPQLRNGLVTVMQQMRAWYGEAHNRAVDIEAARGFAPPLPVAEQRTASFMSGGVDALATLRCNRLDFPLHHPGSIRDCFVIHGLDIGAYLGANPKRENFELTVASLSELAASEHATLIPVYVNLRHLDDHDPPAALKYHGALLAAVAVAFSPRISRALIASSYNVAELEPYGSHPLIDPNYSTAAVCIQHDGARMGRLEKVGLLADWPAALQTLRACYDPFRPDDMLNCGRCEKCLRTMTELLVLDKLRQCRTFPDDDVRPELLRALIVVPPRHLPASPEELLPIASRYFTAGAAYHWRELLEPLRRIDRHDLADVIEAKLEACEKYQASLRRWLALRRAKDALKRADLRYLGGALAALNRLRKRQP